jgi:hypothetical protein
MLAIYGIICSTQSDPSVLELQLRAISKQSSAKSVQIRKIDSGDKNGKEIDKWIKDISDLHRSKPPPTVHYTKQMPDIDRLMQETYCKTTNPLSTLYFDNFFLSPTQSHIIGRARFD